MSGFRSSIPAILMVLSCTHSYALNALVQTTVRAASGEPVGVVQQIVDLDSRLAIPGAVRLPGAVAYHPTRYNSSAALGMVTVGPVAGGRPNTLNARTVLATFHVSPLYAISNDLLSWPRGWKIVSARLIENAPSTGETIVLLERSEGPGGGGRLTVLRGDPATGSFPPGQTLSWDLEGLPVDAALLSDGATLAVLCEDRESTKAFLHIRNVLTGELLHDALELRTGEDQFGSTPIAITLSPGESQLIVLTAGYRIQDSSAQLASWLNFLDPLTFAEPRPPLSLPGTAVLSEDPLQPGQDDSLWIATRSAGTGFAYATKLRLDGAAFEIAVHVPLSGVDRAFKIAVAPIGSAVAVAADERLEVWPDGTPAGPAKTFSAPIGALVWSPHGIFVGEGGRVHWLDAPTLVIRSTVQLQSGHVTEILPLPPLRTQDRDGDGLTLDAERALGTSPISPDTDGDGIPDGVDPEPRTPSPRLELPATVTLRGEAAGVEVLTFSLGDERSVPVEVRLDDEKAPWLEVRSEFLSFEGPRLTLAVDPARYSAVEDEWLSVAITARLPGTRAGVEAAGSPARMVVDVAPPRGGVRRVLWVWSERDDARSLRAPASKQRFSKLAEMLAGPPFHYSHQDVWGPFEEPVEPYEAVFLTMEAALEGALTRQVILDYVAHGGALLFVAGHADTRVSEGIERWLEPAGITLAADIEVQGSFQSSHDHEVVRNWDGFSIRDGCVIRAGRNVRTVVPNPDVSDGAILALRAFGFGRIAVLASGTPLENAVIYEPKHARFAHDLFRWLLSGRSAIQDQDADGLPDYVEDANGNGVVDAGETNFLDADSDDDGIPDGAEDVNGNGSVDQGETNPRNRDSDNDGILDGADAFPLPAPGMPQIATIDPQSGPAEGGTVVELRGQNFTPNSSVWFGEQRSERVRRAGPNNLIAVAPAAKAGEADAQVTVRVVDSTGEREASLPLAFRYTPKSRVGLGFDLLRVAQRQYEIYTGAMSVVLNAANLKVGQADFLVFMSPADAIDAIRVVTSPELRAAQRTLIMKRTSPSTLLISVSPGLPLSGRVTLGTLQWTTIQGLAQSRLQFTIANSIVRVHLGGTIYVDARTLRVNLPQPAPSRAPPG
ncbi:MAG: IPT/TIG domain-containing protein [Candidatus Hydrogenedentes bacterium]|nr:IPT/TIG domain-containing protein [Candidatus Hydrogenedentota bacterium]